MLFTVAYYVETKLKKSFNFVKNEKINNHILSHSDHLHIKGLMLISYVSVCYVCVA
jgi:hypothetical protein